MVTIPDSDKKDLRRRFKKDLKSEVSMRLFTRRASMLNVLPPPVMSGRRTPSEPISKISGRVSA